MEAFSSSAFAREFRNIAQWWHKNAFDDLDGGLFGEIDHFGQPLLDAPKSSLLCSRALWFFSEAADACADDAQLHQCYKNRADELFVQLTESFWDGEYDGVYWLLESQGAVLNDRKQIVAQAYAIYGLARYFQLSQDRKALELALKVFSRLQQSAWDTYVGGYPDALSRQWQPLNDQRLSPDDDNRHKGANTQLHVIEAYTLLYKVSQKTEVKAALKKVVAVFFDKVLDKRRGILRSAFDRQWLSHARYCSLGHGIEASWLLWQAVLVLDAPETQEHHRQGVLNLARTCLNMGMGSDGQLLDRFSLESMQATHYSQWWVQCEALLGFYNAWQLSGDSAYMEACESIWAFIQHHHLDKVNGEWFWYGINEQAGNSSKAGLWKCPYHNGRAMSYMSQWLQQQDLL